MTTANKFSDQVRGSQDGVERGLWGKLEYVDGAGAVLSVRGTDTVDEEVVVINIGQSMNLPDDTDTEVFMLVSGADTTQKYAILTIPRDKARRWAQGTGGIQNPTDPDKAVEFNGKRTHVTEDNFAVGSGGTLEVVGDTVYVRGNLVVERVVTANQEVITPVVNPGSSPVPGFDP